MTRLIATIDLDSTLYNTDGREEFIDRSKGTDWLEYSMLCHHDIVDQGVLALVRALKKVGVEVHYVTGRMAGSREATLAKFEADDVPCDGLWMDESVDGGDHIQQYGSHAKYKVARIKALIEELEAEHIVHVDDYASVKIELEEDGIACIAVKTPREVLLTARRFS